MERDENRASLLEVLAEDFNRKVGGNFADDVRLADLTGVDRELNESERTAVLMGWPRPPVEETPNRRIMNEYLQRLDRFSRQAITTPIRAVQRGIWNIEGFRDSIPERVTVGDIRRIDLDKLKRINPIGPRRATFLKRGFAKLA